MYPRHIILTFLTAALLVFGSAGALLADDIEIGDTRDGVINTLGKPDGRAVLGDTEVLYFPRGQVDIKDGNVVRLDMISPAELDARRQSRLKAEQEQRGQAAEQQTQLMAQKNAQPEPAPTGPQLAQMSGEEQVAYWMNYQRKNPGANVSAQLRTARAQVAEDARKKAEIEQKIEEGMKYPPYKMSASKLRRYRRGRSKATMEMRREQLRKQYEQGPN